MKVSGIADQAQSGPREILLRHQVLEGRRLVLASNRGPIEYRLDENGTLIPHRGAGGVVSALAALGQYTDVHWICAALTEGDRRAAQERAPTPPEVVPPRLNVEFVVVPEEVFNRHYNVISNPILWFIHHYLWNAAYGPQIDVNVREAWEEGYVVVNHAFAEHLVRHARRLPGEREPFFLLHDYQLYLTPGLLRQRYPEAIVSHFIHIPWPVPGYWQLLPEDMRCAIVRSLCQADVVGFQTDQFARNFLDTCADFLDDVEVDRDSRTVTTAGHVTHVRAYPISIDVAELRNVMLKPVVNRHVRRLNALTEGKRTIVRVDRLDPSKNVLRGFEAFRLLLERRPDLHEKLVFLAFLVPSRTSIPEYRRYRDRVFALIDEINTRFGTNEWTPIHVFYENNFHQALAGMQLADVMLVNPVMDGMNLVAKEAVIVSKRDAVLILSEGAGAHEELGDFALTVGLADVDGTTKAIEQALAMPVTERAARAAALRQIVESHDLQWWIDTQLADLDEIARRRQPRCRAPVGLRSSVT